MTVHLVFRAAHVTYTVKFICSLTPRGGIAAGILQLRLLQLREIEQLVESHTVNRKYKDLAIILRSDSHVLLQDCTEI